MTRKRKASKVAASASKSSRLERTVEKPRAEASTDPCLDHNFYPHILDRIFDVSPRAALLSLRAACRTFRDRADSLLAQHVVTYADMGFGHRTMAVGVATHGPGGRAEALPWMKDWRGEWMDFQRDPLSDEYGHSEPSPGSGDNDDYTLTGEWYIHPDFKPIAGFDNPARKKNDPWYDPKANPKPGKSQRTATRLPEYAAATLRNTKIVDVAGCAPSLGLAKVAAAAKNLEIARFYVELLPFNNPRDHPATPLGPKHVVHFTYLHPPKLGALDANGEPTRRLKRRDRITPVGPVADGVEHVTVTIRFWAGNPLLPGGAVIIPVLPESVKTLVLNFVTTRGSSSEKNTRTRRQTANYRSANAAAVPPSPGVLKFFVRQVALLAAVANGRTFFEAGEYPARKGVPKFTIVGAEKIPATALGVDKDGSLTIEEVDALICREMDLFTEAEGLPSKHSIDVVATDDYRKSISWYDAQLQFDEEEILRFA